MIAALKRIYGNFRGFDLTHSTVPPMEGPLKPNTALDAAPIAMTIPGIDNLVSVDGNIICSSGSELLTLEVRPVPGGSSPGLAIAAREAFPTEISCLASDGQGVLAIGLDGQGVVIKGGSHDGKTIADAGGTSLLCPTAVLFLDPDTLLVANGSADTSAGDWKRDLMSHGRSGSVWTVDLAAPASNARAELVADKLAFPTGLAVRDAGGFFISEAWTHRVISVDRPGAHKQVELGNLPAYPGRLRPAAGGGFWLALFAPRNAMVEFVLLEKEYRQRMMDRIDPDHWVAPSLLSGTSFLEPIQGGARKKLNMLKPWSPTWSYGLVARCDSNMRPQASVHSRADGKVHGVTSVCEWEGTLFAGAKGSGVVAALDAAQVAGGTP